MKIDRLEKTIIEMIKEQQMKLGFVKETVRLYFPEASLMRILKTGDEKELARALKEFAEKSAEKLGAVGVSEKNKRYCITISPEGSEYVHVNVPENKFLGDMISLFQNHHLKIEDVERVFKTYSADYVCEKQDGIEFDYLMYFQDKSIDEYYYCIKFDEGHASYHRFSKEDLEEIIA